jgi:predicted membrane metal-binding protein
MPIHTADQQGLFDHVPAQDEAARDEARRKAARRMARHYIAELDAAETMPWDEAASASAAMVVTNATSWLPEEEREALRAAFAAALARHGAGAGPS